MEPYKYSFALYPSESQPSGHSNISSAMDFVYHHACCQVLNGNTTAHIDCEHDCIQKLSSDKNNIIKVYCAPMDPDIDEKFTKLADILVRNYHFTQFHSSHKILDIIKPLCERNKRAHINYTNAVAFITDTKPINRNIYNPLCFNNVKKLILYHLSKTEYTSIWDF